MVQGLPDWLPAAQPPAEADFLLFNNAMELPASPPQSIDAYEFQILQVPLRSVVPEFQLFRMAYDDVAGYEAFFDLCVSRLYQFLEAGLSYNQNHGLLTFVTNLLVPQADPLGRLLPASEPQSLPRLVQRLNGVLAAEIDSKPNAFVVDIDSISAALGRSTVQDDSIWSSVHGGPIGDWDYDRDQARIERPAPMTSRLPSQGARFIEAMWHEVVAMVRTLRRIDSVKLVILDLDDTLWRGVIAEAGQISSDTTEGWPLGLLEALLALKRRGILLAIVSKNDRGTIQRLWPEIFHGILQIDDFATARINWDSKISNVEAILHEMNLLPSSVVFIDDNPVERAAVRSAFPEIRTLGDDLYSTRRILLWSPETQVATITTESSRRTEMVQAQIEREGMRARMTREEFLGTLNVRVSGEQMSSLEHPHFARALELINKTNQFNSTGQRWSVEAASRHFRDGGRFLTFTVVDAFTTYGLTAVAVELSGQILQLVMSCRVVGLDVERAIFQHLQKLARDAGKTALMVKLQETDHNSLVGEVLEANGFVADGGWWSADNEHAFGGAAALQ